jgi:manganese/zinc/iron transport system permease protein
MAFANPYWDHDFWAFFAVLGRRLMLFGQGGVELASDELQILTLSAIAISCGLLGPLLVLKKMTMLANSLSHTILLGLAISFLISNYFFSSAGLDLPHLLLGAFVAALLTVLLTGGLTSVFRLQEDASIGLVFTTLFAIGIIVVTLFMRDVHLSIEVVMGNADALQWDDFKLAAFLSLINFLFVSIFYWPLQISSFDKCQAVSIGVRCNLTHAAILFLVAASCIGAFRAVGVLIVLSFLVGPFLTARLFFDRLWQLLIAAPAIGILASLAGVALARHLLSVCGLALSTGGIVATLIALFYPLAYMIKALLQKKSCYEKNDCLG